MKNKKIHLLKNGNASCGNNVKHNHLPLKEFYNLPEEQQCKNCKATKFYQDQVQELEKKRVASDKELGIKPKTQLEKKESKKQIEEPFVWVNEPILDNFNGETLYIDTNKTSRIFDENDNMIWVKHPQYKPEDVAFKKIDNYKNTPEKYKTTIKNRNGESLVCDVYDIVKAFGISEGSHFQGVKKALCPGIRGVKDFEQDLTESIQCLEIAKLMGKNEGEK